MVVRFDNDGNVPRSSVFDDIYYSVDNGYDESLYNFFKGNDLPNAWQDKKSFTICELGFGTGLNMVIAADLFSQNTGNCEFLHLISIEKYPLRKQEIEKALMSWKEKFPKKLEMLLKNYPPLLPGKHTLHLGGNILLTLIFEEVDQGLTLLEDKVDCWFLDGFNPSKNPDMWSDNVFQHMQRLSDEGTSFATFTAAGFVKRGLESVGFQVGKEKGFGRKRERLKGQIPLNKFQLSTPYIQKKRAKVAIIGGGVAGGMCAYFLKKYGLEVEIFEKGKALAVGASGNVLGMINPALARSDMYKNRLYTHAFSSTRSLFFQLHEQFDIEFHQCGSLNTFFNDKTKERWLRIIASNQWSEDELLIVSPDKASKIANVDVPYEGAYMAGSGKVNPHKLVHALSHEVICHFETEIEDIKRDKSNIFTLIDHQGQEYQGYDYVVIACSYAASKFDFLKNYPLTPIRGQITMVKEPNLAKSLKTNLCFGAYLSAVDQEHLVIGATYDRDCNEDDRRKEDDISNVDILHQSFPHLTKDIEIVEGRAGVRSSSPDYMPYSGALNNDLGTGIYLSLGHRSHGLLSSYDSAIKILQQIKLIINIV